MISFVVDESSKTPFYDTNMFGIIIGFIGSLIVMILTQYVLHLRERKKSKKDLIIAVIQSNPALFYEIFQGSMGNVDYIKLREELKNSNVSYLLAEELRKEFVSLHKIFSAPPNEYRKKKESIKRHLISIIDEIENYGDDILGHK